MDLSKLDEMPSVAEDDSEEMEETEGLDLDPEFAMLAKEAGFDGEKAAALKSLIELCVSNYGK